VTLAAASTFEDAAAAVEELAARAFFADIAKAVDPLSRRGFDLIVARIARRMRAAADPFEAGALESAMAAADVDWELLNPRQFEAALAAVNRGASEALAGALPKIDEALEVTGAQLVGDTRLSFKRRHSLRIEGSLAQRDLTAEKLIRTMNVNFVRDEFGRRAGAASTVAREVVARGLSEGLDRRQVARQLGDALASKIRRSDHYYEVVAAAYTNRARTYSEVMCLADAGVERWQFSAVLDERTTDTCRFYDGQVFQTSRSVEQMESVMSLDNPEEVRNASPWVRQGRDESGGRILFTERNGERTTIAEVTRSGFGSRDDRGSYGTTLRGDELVNAAPPEPPLHGLCRSDIFLV